MHLETATGQCVTVYLHTADGNLYTLSTEKVVNCTLSPLHTMHQDTVTLLHYTQHGLQCKLNTDKIICYYCSGVYCSAGDSCW